MTQRSGMGVGEREVQEGGDICILTLIDFIVQQKLKQYWKATIPQSKKKNYCILWSKSACVLSHFSHLWLSATSWTVAHQGPRPMGFSRQEYWSGLPCPLLGNVPDPGIEPAFPPSPALTGGFFTTSTIWEAQSWSTWTQVYLTGLLTAIAIPSKDSHGRWSTSLPPLYLVEERYCVFEVLPCTL